MTFSQNICLVLGLVGFYFAIVTDVDPDPTNPVTVSVAVQEITAVLVTPAAGTTIARFAPGRAATPEEPVEVVVFVVTPGPTPGDVPRNSLSAVFVDENDAVMINGCPDISLLNGSVIETKFALDRTNV